VEVTYAGPALTPGTHHQFRGTSWRTASKVGISQTEDLRGIFIAK
jgi:hypothetical protein